MADVGSEEPTYNCGRHFPSRHRGLKPWPVQTLTKREVHPRIARSDELASFKEVIMADYLPAVDKLLSLGEPKSDRRWLDYSKMGLTAEHIPALIRMATDPVLNFAMPNDPKVWAPLHAWRALGQLRAEEAVGPLLSMLDGDIEDIDDYALEELPEVFAKIGPGILPVLESHLFDATLPDWSRGAAGHALVHMGIMHSGARSRCVESLIKLLRSASQNPPELNGDVVGDLIDLDALDAAPVIEQAFAGGYVDTSVSGDWPTVQYDMGLTDEPPPDYDETFEADSADPEREVFSPSNQSPSKKLAKAKAKAKRKQAAKSRKINRKAKRRR
jgi:hypothetical protein